MIPFTGILRRKVYSDWWLPSQGRKCEFIVKEAKEYFEK